MKKLFFSIVILLLISTLIGCSLVTPDDADEIRYTPDGRRLIELTIYAGDDAAGGRSLTTMIAESVYNYIEVLIRDGTHYYDANFRRGVPGMIEVPEGLSVNTGASLNAVMFAGYRRTALENPGSPDSIGADLTLLAIGICTELEGNAVGNRVIGPTTTGLKFKLRALETTVTLGAGPIGKPNGFEILAGAGPPAAWPGSTGSRAVFSNGAQAPYFVIPANTPDIEARFKVYGFLTSETAAFAGFPDPGSAVHVNRVMGDNGSGGSMVVPPPLDTVQFVWGGDPIIMKGYADLAEGPLLGGLPGNQLKGTNNSFRLVIDTTMDPETSWRDGWALVGLNIPVRIFGDVSTRRRARNDLWYIRSGMYHDQPDKGYGVESEHNAVNPDAGESHSLGGGVLLRIGDPFLDPSF